MCGATDPSPPKKSTSSGVTKPTASETEEDDAEETKIFSGSAGRSGSSDDDSPGSGVALQVGRAYGLAIVLGGLFAGFALL